MEYALNMSERIFAFTIEDYRKMTGEERLEIAFQMREHECNRVRANIRLQHPGIEEHEVENLFRRRVSAARNFGGDDAVGKLFEHAMKETVG